MIESSPKQSLFIAKIIWFYFEAPKSLLRAWKNYLLYNLEFFSFILLLKTFFSPWRRYNYVYPRGFDIGGYFQVFSFNLISRVLGVIMRTFLIIFGILAEIFIFVLGLSVFVCWLALPILIILGLGFGLSIFKISL